MSDQPLKVIDAKDTKCLKCGITIPKRVVMGHGDGKLKKGMVMVCSSCCTVMVLGDSEWHIMQEAEFKKLDPRTKLSIGHVIQSLMSRLKSGASWNPYENN